MPAGIDPEGGFGSLRQPRNETETRIVDAASRVMHTHGLAGATTKRIAAEAGVAEGSIYRYFERKEDLYLQVLWRIPSKFLTLMAQLEAGVGTVPIREMLVDVATAAIGYFLEVMALSGSIFAEPALRAEFAGSLRERGLGPQRPNQRLAQYIRGEQEAGRIDPGVDPEGMSYALLGGAFQHAFQAAFFGDEIDEAQARQLAEGLVTALALP
jgi:AcrR family transcriptional regulator